MDVQKGDLLLLPDSFWGLGYSVRLAEKACAIGACVIPIIHDIFPITHPEFADTKNVTAFKAAFARLVSASHGLLTVSRFTQREVETLLARQGTSVPPIRSFHLGADAFSEGSQPISLCAEIQQLRDMYLMVGTIEPRKDHITVLDAFERLWSNGGHAILVLVGRIGWRCKGLRERLETHPLRNQRLFVFYDTTDSDLDYLYRQARALVVASRVEGFGLPLVEAMRYGVPVIASRIDVFCEIAGAYPEYFPPGDDQELYRIIERYEREGIVRCAPREWLNWDDAALNAMQLAIQLYESRVASLGREAPALPGRQ
jgi:alpha-1,2-rhamnosyltransferase